jgi:hypothetical protein
MVRTTKENTPADPNLNKKPRKPRLKWEDIDKESQLYQIVNSMCEDPNKGALFNAKTVGEICAVANQQKIKFTVIPWARIFSESGKLTRQHSLMIALFVEEWIQRQNKNWKAEASILQSQLDQALDEIARLKKELENK